MAVTIRLPKQKEEIVPRELKQNEKLQSVPAPKASSEKELQLEVQSTETLKETD